MSLKSLSLIRSSWALPLLSWLSMLGFSTPGFAMASASQSAGSDPTLVSSSGPRLAVAQDEVPLVHGNDPCIQKLAQAITQGQTTDLGKLQAIQKWVANNISYDWAGYNSYVPGDLTSGPTMKQEDALTVLQNKTGVCTGISALTDSLLSASGIESQMVIGNVPFDHLGLGHSYNEALINYNGVPTWVKFDPTCAVTNHGNSSSQSICDNGSEGVINYQDTSEADIPPTPPNSGSFSVAQTSCPDAESVEASNTSSQPAPGATFNTASLLNSSPGSSATSDTTAL